ncbi:MAG: glycosyltransferase family 39 protein [Deltaproteobacteria bacterium]|nr:glycosyltransferase family 39 protein [Deltaproteobacteria bacterium]
MDEQQVGSPAAWPAALPWLVVLFALFAWLGRVDLLTPDEARHAEIAREMLAGGHWLTPRIYGEPYYDKPALFYWLIDGGLALFRPSAWAARLPSTLAALLSIVATSFWVGRAWGRRTAQIVAVVLATTLFFVAVGRYVVVDMLLTAGLTGALSWMGVLLLDQPARRLPTWPMYVFMALGFLAKGPVAVVIVVAVAVVMAIVEKRPALLLELRPFSGVLIVTALAGPWYLGAYLSDPAYINTFLWHHNFARFAVPGALEHQQPWYFYLLALPVCLLPWSIFLAPALRLAWRSPNTGVRHALAWATVVVGFFSFSQTKLPTYVLSAFPALLALVAVYIDETLTRRSPVPRALEAATIAWTILAATIAVGGVVWVVLEAPYTWTRTVLALPAVAVAVWSYRHSHRAESLVAAVAAAALSLIIVVYGSAADAVNSHKSQRRAAQIVKVELPAYAALASYRVAPHAMAFYSARMVRRCADPESATAELIAGADAALLTRRKFLPELGLEPLPRWLALAWSSGDGQVLVVGGTLAANRPVVQE